MKLMTLITIEIIDASNKYADDLAASYLSKPEDESLRKLIANAFCIGAHYYKEKYGLLERDRAEKFKKALEFYARGEHVEGDDYDVETMDQADFDIHEYRHGKRAREALKDGVK